MKVSLGNNLEEYLHEHHHNTISLELSLECAPHDGEQFLNEASMPEPRIVFSKPINITGYDKFKVHDITVYVERNIKADNNNLIIMDQVVAGTDTCHVEGWIGNHQ